jgi:hypothetical protein
MNPNRFYYKTIGTDSTNKPIYEKIYQEWKGEIHFKTNAQVAIWNAELLGQMSDGLFENSSVDWGFWSELEPIVKEPKGWLRFDNVIPHSWGLYFGEIIEFHEEEMLFQGKCGLTNITNSTEIDALRWDMKGIGQETSIQDELYERFKCTMHHLELEILKKNYTKEQLEDDLDYITEVMDTSIRKIVYID